MHKIMIVVTVGLVLLTGCGTVKYLVLSHTGQYYEATNTDCPKVEILENKSINCYTDNLKFIRHERVVPREEVAAYRDALKERRDKAIELRMGRQALERRAFNPNSPRI